MGSELSNLTAQSQINHRYWKTIQNANVAQMLNYLINMCHQPDLHPKHVWDLPLIYQLIIYCTRFKKEDFIIVCQHYEDYFKSQIHIQLDCSVRLHFVADADGLPTCGQISPRSKKGHSEGITYALHGCRPIQLLGIMKSNLALFNKRSQRSKNYMAEIYDYLEKYLIDLANQVPRPQED
jgi:hypothetical protein